MFGILVNVVAVIVGSLIGLLFRRLITKPLGARIQVAFGYITLVIGFRMAMQFQNILVFVLCIAVGGVIGWLVKMEKQIEDSEKILQKYVMKGRESTFTTGLSIASILFCVGGMSIIGPIEAAVTGNNDVLFTKSVLDGVTSIVLASLYGIGVIFAAVPVLLYQGAIALIATQIQSLNNPEVLAEVSGVGGVMILMIGINLSKLGKVPVGDFLPSLALVLLWALFV